MYAIIFLSADFIYFSYYYYYYYYSIQWGTNIYHLKYSAYVNPIQFRADYNKTTKNNCERD